MYQTRLEAQYYEVLHLRNARFFRHLRGVFTVISLLAGTAAFTMVLQADARLAVVGGGLIALVTILDSVVNPSARVVMHDHQARNFSLLQAEGRGLDEEAFEKRLAFVRVNDDVNCLETLRYVAYNEVVVSAGRDECAYPLTAWQKLVGLMA